MYLCLSRSGSCPLSRVLNISPWATGAGGLIFDKIHFTNYSLWESHRMGHLSQCTPTWCGRMVVPYIRCFWAEREHQKNHCCVRTALHQEHLSTRGRDNNLISFQDNVNLILHILLRIQRFKKKTFMVLSAREIHSQVESILLIE